MEETERTGTELEEALPTIWHTPDDLWNVFSALIAQYDPPKPKGRKRIDARNALDGIIYRARTGCQWNHLPKEFGDDSSIHRTFVRWNQCGLYDQLWALLLSCCEELGGVDWQWQSADGCMGKARGVPKRGRRRKRSAPIPPTAEKPEPRRAC